MEIYNISGKVIYESDADTMRQTVIDALWDKVDLSGASLSGLNLDGINFRNAILREADLSGSSICGNQFEGADFSGAYMEEADFGASNIRDANFSGAYMERADFAMSNICGVSFARAKLRGAKFDSCHINGVDFTGADLTSASLFWASLTDVCLRDANLRGVDLHETTGLYIIGPTQGLFGKFIYVVRRDDGQEPIISYGSHNEPASIFLRDFPQIMAYDRDGQLYEQQIRVAVQLMSGQPPKSYDYFAHLASNR